MRCTICSSFKEGLLTTLLGMLLADSFQWSAPAIQRAPAQGCNFDSTANIQRLIKVRLSGDYYFDTASDSSYGPFLLQSCP